MSGCTQESCWACWCVYRTYVIGQVWRSACFGVWTEQMKTGHKEPFSLAAFGSYFNTNNCGIVLSLSLWEWHGDSPMQQSQVAMEGGSNGLVCSILKMKPRKDVWSQMICLGLFVSVLVDLWRKYRPAAGSGWRGSVPLLKFAQAKPAQTVGSVLSCWLWMMKAAFPPASTEPSWKRWSLSSCPLPEDWELKESEFY